MSDPELRKAHDLIEQGRTAEARQLLASLDDPTARQWLAQLDARKRPAKRTSPIPVPLPLLIAVAVVIGVGAIIVMILLTPTLLSRIQNRSVESAESLAATQTVVSSSLYYYCTVVSSTDTQCADWTAAVMSSSYQIAMTCLASSGTETPEQMNLLGACLTQGEVPAPPM